ncbi:hypothetical protein AMTRI_Chr03g147440 [Amborella trichopoda]
MASECQGKSSWPELVGVNGEIAAATIEKENPTVKAVVLPEGIILDDPEFRCDRVVVWVEPGIIVGNVTRVPVIG